MGGGNIDVYFWYPKLSSVSKMRVVRGISILLLAALLSPVCLAQLPSSSCDRTDSPLADCTSFAQPQPSAGRMSSSRTALFDPGARFDASSAATTDRDSDSGVVSAPSERKGLDWGRALTESFTFLVIEQAYVVHTDFNWVVVENGIPFNHYWRDYNQSLTSWWHAGWSAGEDPLYNYVGHPIQGAMTGYIELQNDPKYYNLEFSNTKPYWRSRLKAMLWNAVYSTQWSIGLLSEMTVEKYGTAARPPWNANGTFPCDTKTCYSGVGKVNLVMTPVGGFGWMLTEDILDKKIVEWVEGRTDNRFLINTLRCSLNPIRGGANILHGRRPWYRASRDEHTVSLLRQPPNAVVSETVPKTQVPSWGDVFLGFSHIGSSNCEVPTSGASKPCDPLSAKAEILNGWDLGLEKKYFKYFGTIAEVSGQYGGASQGNYMVGIRGGASLGRFRPFAQVMFGAVHDRISGPPAESALTFAEDLGVGLDFHLTRLMSWRTHVDEIKTGDNTFERYNVRVASGLAVRF